MGRKIWKHLKGRQFLSYCRKDVLSHSKTKKISYFMFFFVLSYILLHVFKPSFLSVYCYFFWTPSRWEFLLWLIQYNVSSKLFKVNISCSLSFLYLTILCTIWYYFSEPERTNVRMFQIGKKTDSYSSSDIIISIKKINCFEDCKMNFFSSLI